VKSHLCGYTTNKLLLLLHTCSPTETTPLVNHSSHTNTTSHAYSPAQTTQLLNCSSGTHTVTSHTYSPTRNTTTAFNHSTGKHTNTSHKHTPLTGHNSHTTLQNPFFYPSLSTQSRFIPNAIVLPHVPSEKLNKISPTGG